MESRAPEGYALDATPKTIKIKAGDAQTLTVYNKPLQTLTIYKYEKGTTKPIEGVTFLLTDNNGGPIGGGNGEYTTDANGRIAVSGLEIGTSIVAKEIRTVSGYTLSGTPQTLRLSIS